MTAEGDEPIGWDTVVTSVQSQDSPLVMLRMASAANITSTFIETAPGSQETAPRETCRSNQRLVTESNERNGGYKE
jgi:hypothetical protein